MLVVATTVSALSDPAAAVAPVVAAQTGVGHLAGPVTANAWPTVALVVGAVDVLAAVWLVRRVPSVVRPDTPVPGDARRPPDQRRPPTNGRTGTP